MSLTINDLHEEEDLAMALVQNGPGVPGAVEKLIRDFHANWIANEQTKQKTDPQATPSKD